MDYNHFHKITYTNNTHKSHKHNTNKISHKRESPNTPNDYFTLTKQTSSEDTNMINPSTPQTLNTKHV